MKLLLDTHALLWWLGDDPRLGKTARTLIGDADTQVLVSVVSFWEMAVKTRIGKLTANVTDIWGAVAQADFDLLEIRLAHLTDLTLLPTLHRDPFDHLLIAQSRVEGAILLSQDKNISNYPVETMACSNGL